MGWLPCVKTNVKIVEAQEKQRSLRKHVLWPYLGGGGWGLAATWVLVKMNHAQGQGMSFESASQVIPCATREGEQVTPVPKGEDPGSLLEAFWNYQVTWVFNH